MRLNLQFVSLYFVNNDWLMLLYYQLVDHPLNFLFFSPIRLLPNFPFCLTVDPPEITQHPKGQSVATGADITFTIVASGDNLQFQWQKDGDDIGSNESWLCSSKPNTSTLKIPCVKKSDKGCYKCLVKNPVECSEVSSYEAEVTVCKFVVKCYNALWKNSSSHHKDQSVCIVDIITNNGGNGYCACVDCLPATLRHFYSTSVIITYNRYLYNL